MEILKWSTQKSYAEKNVQMSTLALYSEFHKTTKLTRIDTVIYIGQYFGYLAFLITSKF